ncbi:hypothetical protein BsWGS_24108 [Bradybaena similaris]
MRGKIYGYKTAGRHNSQVNLAAYQAFAMQQRALLQQALTYESYLQKAAVGSGQAAQLFHHSQGIGGTGTSLVASRPPDSATSPRSPLKLEQVTPPSTPSDMDGGVHEKRSHNHGSPHNHEALLSPVRVNTLTSMPLVSGGVIQSPPALLPGHYSTMVKTDGIEAPHSRAGSLPSFSSFRSSQRSLDNLQTLALGPRHLPPGHRPHTHLSDNHTLPHPNLRLTQEMISFHQHHNNNVISAGNNNNTANGPIASRRMPPPLSPQGLIDHDKLIDHQGRISRELEQRHLSRENNSREFDMKRENEREMNVQNGSSRDYGHDHNNSMEHQRNNLQENHNGSAAYQHSHHQPLLHERVESHNTSSSHSMDEDHHKSYPCDSVMDLSMNKSSNSPSSRASSTASSSIDKEASGVVMPPPKTPTSIGAESESEPGKRDVTTTSATPTVDSGGIHHCQHCNIFFYDYTMFHLHESLHMPYEDHPFRCPSCGTHCQDKIEFMFHTVWHVKYPHTIPNYTPFREGFLSSSP